METTSKVNQQNSMRAQVASSKGTEWMVSAYNEWQKRSPLESIPPKNPSSVMRLVSKLEQQGNQLNGVLALSFKSILLILGLIMSVKGR